MAIIFYILDKGKRMRFESANELHDYITTHKLSAKAVIQLKEDKNVIGEMKVVRYIQLSKR